MFLCRVVLIRSWTDKSWTQTDCRLIVRMCEWRFHMKPTKHWQNPMNSNIVWIVGRYNLFLVLQFAYSFSHSSLIHLYTTTYIQVWWCQIVYTHRTNVKKDANSTLWLFSWNFKGWKWLSIPFWGDSIPRSLSLSLTNSLVWIIMMTLDSTDIRFQCLM